MFAAGSLAAAVSTRLFWVNPGIPNGKLIVIFEVTVIKLLESGADAVSCSPLIIGLLGGSEFVCTEATAVLILDTFVWFAATLAALPTISYQTQQNAYYITITNTYTSNPFLFIPFFKGVPGIGAPVTYTISGNKPIETVISN